MRLGADWQDFVPRGCSCGCGTEDPSFPLTEALLADKDDEEVDELDLPTCDCCLDTREDLNEDGVCADCEEDGRLEREHQAIESALRHV